MKKRTWHYVTSPINFDLHCTEDRDHNITWSEFEDHVWCYDCEKDIEYKSGYSIFPTKLAEIVGISFDKIDLERNLYLKYNSDSDTYEEIPLNK